MGGYSADVCINLITADAKVSIGNLGPTWFIANHPLTEPIAPCDGVIEMSVDGRKTSFLVSLPEGVLSRPGVTHFVRVGDP